MRAPSGSGGANTKGGGSPVSERPRLSRRGFFGLSAGALGAALLPTFSSGATDPHDRAVRLGVASYSLRKLSRTEAIAALREIGSPWVNIKSVHLAYDSSPEELARGRREFESAGLEIVGGGTITLDKEDDGDVRRTFDYARHAGFPLMVIAPTPGNLERIERFVKEYDIKVAIHNHGPEDRHFPGPREALKLIEGMDPRVGVCVDCGHTARTGIDVVEAIAEAGPRVLDMHLKDLRDLASKESQCIVGEGKMPIAGIFRQLADMGYEGTVNLEYEIDADDPLPGMLRSFAYMRGVLDGLGL